MKYQEKKYKVSSFIKIRKLLKAAGAKKGKKIITTHYYAQQDGNDVIKLVKYVNKNEIHILKESNGKFSLKESIPVESTNGGLQHLKDKGYKTVNPVKMVHTDYEYRNGIVGLYLIDDFLNSIILDFPESLRKEVEKEMGLERAEVVSLPYNKFLGQINRLRKMKL